MGLGTVEYAAELEKCERDASLSRQYTGQGGTNTHVLEAARKWIEASTLKGCLQLRRMKIEVHDAYPASPLILVLCM